MLVSGSHFRPTFPCAVVLLVLALAGCGNSCFAGFSNNGTGVVIIKVSNPPSSCSLNQVNGTMQVIVVKPEVCETCAGIVPQEHVFLTLRGIQVQSADANAPAWLEIAPQLANEPRQIDLTNSHPDVLVEHALLPAGSYRELRLQFLTEAPRANQSPPAENLCRDKGWNCLIANDGQIEPIQQAELLLNLESMQQTPFLLLPDSWVHLQIDLGATPSALHFSDSSGARLQTVIVGNVTVAPHAAERQQHFDSE
jgi:hypothetical protein